MGEKDGEARKIKDHLDAHNEEKERENLGDCCQQ